MSSARCRSPSVSMVDNRSNAGPCSAYRLRNAASALSWQTVTVMSAVVPWSPSAPDASRTAISSRPPCHLICSGQAGALRDRGQADCSCQYHPSGTSALASVGSLVGTPAPARDCPVACRNASQLHAGNRVVAGLPRSVAPAAGQDAVELVAGPQSRLVETPLQLVLADAR